MEHPGHQGTPTGVGQGCVRLDALVTPHIFRVWRRRASMRRPSHRYRECKTLREGSMNEIVTLAERLTPLIGDLRHTTENDRST
jgi:hypothetical protein